MVAEELGHDHDVKFEHECYDVGHLYNLELCIDSSMFKAPIFIQFVLGLLGGVDADLENLVFMKRTADKLFGDQYQWSVLGAETRCAGSSELEALAVAFVQVAFTFDVVCAQHAIDAAIGHQNRHTDVRSHPFKVRWKAKLPGR